MRHVELLIHSIGRWAPGDVAFIRSLRYRAEQAASPADLHLECILERRDSAPQGWPSDANQRFRATLHFTGVRDFSISDFGGGDTQVMGFGIADISDRGWEQVKYEVGDYEAGRIHFLCSDVEVVEVASL